MEINIPNIYNEVINLTSLIEDYEKNYLNMYKVLMDDISYWKDNRSNNFYNHLNQEKSKVDQLIDELSSLKSLYSLICDKYKNIGNKIFFNDENATKLLIKIDNYINFQKKILAKYSNLNLQGNDYELILLKNQISILNSNIKKMKEIKFSFNNMINEINSIEKIIKAKIEKLNIGIVKESDINEFI